MRERKEWRLKDLREGRGRMLDVSAPLGAQKMCGLCCNVPILLVATAHTIASEAVIQLLL